MKSYFSNLPIPHMLGHVWRILLLKYNLSPGPETTNFTTLKQNDDFWWILRVNPSLYPFMSWTLSIHKKNAELQNSNYPWCKPPGLQPFMKGLLPPSLDTTNRRRLAPHQLRPQTTIISSASGAAATVLVDQQKLSHWGFHQLRLVVEIPREYKLWDTSKRWLAGKSRISAINSMACQPTALRETNY